jgi:hypothetical protein
MVKQCGQPGLSRFVLKLERIISKKDKLKLHKAPPTLGPGGRDKDCSNAAIQCNVKYFFSQTTSNAGSGTQESKFCQFV